MPPIMGVAAFLMAGILGIPYIQVCAYAIIPAVFFYLSLGIGVHLHALKLNVTIPVEKADPGMILRKGFLFIVPLTIIIITLVRGYSPMTAGFAGVVSTIVLSYTTKDTRLSLKQLVRGFRQGAAMGAQVAAVSGALGIIAALIGLTGLGFKISNSISMLSGGNLPLALLLMMAVTIIVSCGAPTIVAYSVVAIVGAPALVRMGVDLIAAHFFVFYFAAFAGITPPVATGAVVASRIAGGNYLKTALQGCRLILPAFIIPWLFVWNPALIGQFSGVGTGLVTMVATLLSIIAIEVTLIGHFLTPISLLQRGVFGVLAGILIACIVSQSYMFFGIGAILFILATIWQFWERKLLQRTAQR